MVVPRVRLIRSMLLPRRVISSGPMTCGTGGVETAAPHAVCRFGEGAHRSRELARRADDDAARRHDEDDERAHHGPDLFGAGAERSHESAIEPERRNERQRAAEDEREPEVDEHPAAQAAPLQLGGRRGAPRTQLVDRRRQNAEVPRALVKRDAPREKQPDGDDDGRVGGAPSEEAAESEGAERRAGEPQPEVDERELTRQARGTGGAVRQQRLSAPRDRRRAPR